MNEESIIDAIDANKEEIIEFCQKLIQTDSVNPPGNEKNVALVIKDFLDKNGIKCEIIDIGDNRANLIASIKGEGNKNLLFNGHMDVVPIEKEEQWKYPPFAATIKRKKIIGRGAADMKGPLAAMIMAMVFLKRIDFPLKGNLIINCVADEETLGALGTKYCVEQCAERIKADAIIVCEPSGMDPLPKAILLGEKGRAEIEITVHGRSCHASMPSLGVNPIDIMNDVLFNMQRLKTYIPEVKPPISKEELKSMLKKGFPSEEIFQRIYNDQPQLQALLNACLNFTYSTTKINSGIKENVVPGDCKAVIDFRLIPGQDPNIIVNGLKEYIKDLGYDIKDPKDAKDNDIYVSIKINSECEASILDNFDYEIIDLVYNTYVDVYKTKPFKFLMPATTDARFFRNTGFCKQVIVFGPGNATSAHAVNEDIEIKDLINATKVYSLVAAKFLS